MFQFGLQCFPFLLEFVNWLSQENLPRVQDNFPKETNHNSFTHTLLLVSPTVFTNTDSSYVKQKSTCYNIPIQLTYSCTCSRAKCTNTKMNYHSQTSEWVLWQTCTMVWYPTKKFRILARVFGNNPKNKNVLELSLGRVPPNVADPVCCVLGGYEDLTFYVINQNKNEFCF